MRQIGWFLFVVVLFVGGFLLANYLSPPSAVAQGGVEKPQPTVVSETEESGSPDASSLSGALTPLGQGDNDKIELISDLVQAIKEGKVVALNIKSDGVEVTTKDGEKSFVYMGTDAPEAISTLRDLGVTAEELEGIDITYPSPPTNWGKIIKMVVMLGFFIFLIWQSKQGGGGLGGPGGGFTKSGARVFASDKPVITFDDVAGVEEAVEELQEVVEFLKDPDKFTRLGARVPKGVLLVGPPGCGKTLMARAVAGEAGVPFFSIAGSEFIEMFVGVGAGRVRDLFDQAKKAAPSIVFIDDIDAMGGMRGGFRSGGDKEYAQTLTQVLAEMDGFTPNDNVVVIAATNRPDILDPALLRPGRFDRKVVVDRPDLTGRKAILEIHAKGKPLAKDVDLVELARRTPGFTGADIENLVNEAALLAVRRNRDDISRDEFRDAVERVLAGPERKSRRIGEEEKRIIAYHEVGHALVMHGIPLCDPVRKVSIVARGLGLGYTLSTPEEDLWLQSKARLKATIAGLLGGRAAEELIFGPEGITTGAANDLERATQIAREMVARFGMSKKIGLLSFTSAQMDFLRQGLYGELGFSQETAREIEEEARRILEEQYGRATEILEGDRETLDQAAQALLKEETLEREEFLAIVNGSLDDSNPEGGH